MQLSRWAVCALVLAAGTAHAEPTDERRASASLSVYSDNDHITVVTPSAGVQLPIGESLGFDANVVADVISGASVDVVSEASPTPISERRLEVGAGVAWQFHRLAAARLRAIGSTEHDFDALRINLGFNVELAQHNTTLDVDYMGGPDRVTSVVDPTFEQRRTNHRLMTTLTQVVDPRTYVDLAMEGQYAHGFQGSPYRTVPIADPLTSMLVRVQEATPKVRKGAAVRVRVRRAVDAAARLALHLSYRYYIDDWSVDSHTAALTAIAQTSARTELGVTLRGYLQSAADFYQPRYQLVDGAVPELRTRERRLGRMRSVHAAATFDIQLGDGHDSGLRLVLAAALLGFWWPDFPAQRRRLAGSMTISVSSPF